MRFTIGQYRQDPELRRRIEAAARRERMAAMHRLVFAPLKALFRRPPLRASRMLHRSAMG